MERLNIRYKAFIKSIPRLINRWLPGLCLAVAASSFTAPALSSTVQSKIFIQNDTSHELLVDNLNTSGDPLSKKAWKQGATTVSPGARESVLTLNRSGKVNWMDPTPRFIEPGKTALFTIEITLADAVQDNSIKLKQKLFGTGKSSKMWHSIDAQDQSFDWSLNDTEFQGIWNPSPSIRLKFKYRSFTENGATHVQYVFSPAES